MTVPMETMPMVNDLGSSSSASNKCETTDMVKIEPTCEFTPPSTPSKPGFSVTDQEQMRVSIFAQYVKHEHKGIYELQEAVATILSKSSPDLLISFLDPEVVTFKAIFKHDKQLVIWRKGNAVFIGIFENHTTMKKFGFEHLVGAKIGWDGAWSIIAGAGNAFCDSKWPDAWAGRYECFGGVNKMSVEYESMVEEKAQRASILASDMLEGMFWSGKVEVKTT